MASIREIRLRMNSIQETMKITNAMYLISSSKMKKAKKEHDQTAPYFELLQSAIATMLSHSPELSHRYLCRETGNKKKRTGYIVITGDKGLCGAYNHNVIKLAEAELLKNQEATLFIVGIMGRKYFEKKNVTIDGEFLYTAQKPSIHRARSIAESLLTLYDQEHLDEINIIYTKMLSTVKMEPRVLRLLPLERTRFDEVTKERYRQITTFVPSAEAVLDYLVPNYLKGLIYGALVESFSSEQNSRMSAMDAATKSARDMLSQLTIQYNRARQTAITQEITEVVGGAYGR